MEELAGAAMRAAAGEATLHPRVAARIIQELHSVPREDVNSFKELTNREMEVLKLIANGLNNGEIAGHLVLSEHTVKGHMSDILSKLQLVDQTQAAVYAWRKSVVRRD